MLVQLRDFPEHLAEQLKLQLNQRTASKAVEFACKYFVSQRAEISRLRDQIKALEEAVRVRDQVIDRARESASALLDHVAQGDLLSK